MSNMGQPACVDLGGGQQQRETQLLSDANSTIGKFLQASTSSKMHVQVQCFAGQHKYAQKNGKKNPFILVVNFKLNPNRVETLVEAALLTFENSFLLVLRNWFQSFTYSHIHCGTAASTLTFFFPFWGVFLHFIDTYVKSIVGIAWIVSLCFFSFLISNTCKAHTLLNLTL